MESASFFNHSVNLIVFTVLLVHLILRISPHHSPCLHSHHLSLPKSSQCRLKTHSFHKHFPLNMLALSRLSFTELDSDRKPDLLLIGFYRATARCYAERGIATASKSVRLCVHDVEVL